MNLRQQVLKGGVYLAFRQGLGIVIGLGGMLLLTRLIGPANYGLYTGALAIITFLLSVGRFGVDVYLVRREQAPTTDMYHQAFSFLLLLGIVLTSVVFFGSPFVIGSFVDSQFVLPLQVLSTTLPLSLLAIPAVAQLERELNYRAVALLELLGQVSYYVVALVLAYQGLQSWAPVIGYWVWQVLFLLASYQVARFRPRLVWSHTLVQEMTRYGLGYSSSSWVWQLRSLVNPLVVGRFLGPEGVGYVSLAIRLVELLSFVKSATWRLSIAALSKVQKDQVRLKHAMEEAMGLQVLCVGPLLAGFASVAPWLLPILFGHRWDLVLQIFPFVALSYLVNSAFNMHSSVLYVLQRNWDVTLFHLVHIALFAVASLIIIPKVGIIGYGLAELVALLSYFVIHQRVARLFSFSYRTAFPWLVSLSLPLFSIYLPVVFIFVLWLFVLVVSLYPAQRRRIVEYLQYFRWRTA